MKINPQGFPRLLIALLGCVPALVARAAEPDTASPVASYRFYDSLAEAAEGAVAVSPIASYQFCASLTEGGEGAAVTASPVVSYQFCDTLDTVANVLYASSPEVSYNYPQYFDLDILQQPSGRAFRAGETFELAVKARGVEPLRYQWYVNQQPIPGAEAATLVLSEARQSQAGVYYATVSDGLGRTIQSASATLSFTSDLGGKKVALPRIRPGSMPFETEFPLELTCATPGAVILYSIQPPACTVNLQWQQYDPDHPPMISESCVVYARATKPSCASSNYVSATYIRNFGNNSLQAALGLGAVGVGDVKRYQGGLTKDDPVDYYSFDLPQDVDVNISLSDVMGGSRARMELLDSSGKFLAKPNVARSAVSYFNHYPTPSSPLKAGRYYLRVLFEKATVPANATGVLLPIASLKKPPVTYRLQISTGPNRQIVTMASEAHHIGLVPLGARARVEYGKPTWVIIHGRHSSPYEGSFLNLESAITETHSGDQVIGVDWETAAGLGGPVSLEGAKWIPFVANWVGPRLAELGLARENLNIVGHSWGTYVGYEASAKISGSNAVRRFVALDPAARGTYLGDATGYSPSRVKFKSHSSYSWAFVSRVPLDPIQYGNPDTAATASNSFVVSWPPFTDSTVSHCELVNVFAEMVRDTGGQWSGASPYFGLEKMLLAAPPWRLDMFDEDGNTRPLVTRDPYPFEAVLPVNYTNREWKPVSAPRFVPFATSALRN